MDKLSNKVITERKKWALGLAKFFSIAGYKLLAKPHVEIHEGLEPLKKEQSIFLYVGLHKSLWETTGILAALYLNLKNMQVPYAGMGDNLVKGRFFQTLAKKAGIFLIKRARTRKEILESAKLLKEYIIHFISHGLDVMIFPEGTRKSIPTQGTYGKFFPTVFEALLEYEKNKEKILGQKKNLHAYDTYIIPTNVDYSKVREDKELLVEYKKPRTLKLKDSLKMVKHIREAYISVGEPIKVADHPDKNRKELAAYAREKCLDLVKILPINIVSHAILDSVEGDQIKIDKIEENITGNIQKLAGLKNRFRGFSIDDHPGDLLEKVARYEMTFKPKYINIKNKPLYQLYANYIRHYFTSGGQGPHGMGDL
ncbi:MAG: 1-acyl-sn-glycerol-3-phosphate acyltransferase [Candidatus Aminicenantes bacterium]|nr:MAG: 1-acyl-sn-glycerol-3-phosphate acyltransferase [Candidatus Aminicenantes bacterium]